MSDLLISPLGGAFVLAAIVFVLVRRASREAAREPVGGSAWLLAPLLALFVAQVVGRFLHG
jgi:hypothetical protein